MGLRDFFFCLIVILLTAFGGVAWFACGFFVMSDEDADAAAILLALAPLPFMYALVIGDFVAYGESVNRYPALRPPRAAGLVLGTLAGMFVGAVVSRSAAAPFVFGLLYGLPFSWLFDRAWYTLLRKE